MWKSIKLVLLNFLIAQIAAPILILIPCALYMLITTGNLEVNQLTAMILIPAQLAGQLMMGLYLWKAGYISSERTTWLPVSLSFLLLSILAILSGAVVVTALTDQLTWIPNLIEQSLDFLQNSWAGILAIVLVGPIVEELLFRGAITKILLHQYSPVAAILLSALLFGLFHINPAQIIPAFLIGILLAWAYYKTGSLIPCILMHIANNSLSVYLSLKYPESKTLEALVGEHDYLLFILIAVVLLSVALWGMTRSSAHYPWSQKSE